MPAGEHDGTADEPAAGDDVVVVTGATAGIGRAIAQLVADRGARVLAIGRSPETAALLAKHPAIDAHVGDIREPGVAGAAIEQAQRLGRVVGLVNNAAVDHAAPLLDATVEEARDVFETNVFAALAMLQHAVRAMRHHGDGGSIVNVTSRLASIGVPTMSIYGASKGALLALTKGAAIEFAAEKIRVNAVAPGMTRTPLYEEWLRSQDRPDEIEARVLGAIPQQRLGTVDDVAEVVAFLLSPAAAHITGASIPVDGGYTAA